MSDWRIDKKGNKIHRTAKISFYDEIEIGNNNLIGPGVRITCERFCMGSNCKLHNHVFIDGNEVMIGDNVWIGQYSHLDGMGGLYIQDDVTIGYNCYIWTHAGRSGMLEGCLLAGTKPVFLRRGVWLMGCNVVVNPGVAMRPKSIALSNSVVTKDTWPGKVYGGVPAIELDIEAWE